MPRSHSDLSPTMETYQELQTAYNHFNTYLFDSTLPDCLITLQREKNTSGYFSAQRFGRRDGTKTDEIAMNPAFFGIVDPTEIMQTLVHESVHLWQYHFGTPGRRRYHNKEWANKMESIGLMPSATGKSGGKKTGERMADYVVERGAFEMACKALFTDEFKISWFDRFPPRKQAYSAIALASTVAEPDQLDDCFVFSLDSPIHDAPDFFEFKDETKQTRSKYTCSCGFNVWGKPGLDIICGQCRNTYISSDALTELFF